MCIIDSYYLEAITGARPTVDELVSFTDFVTELG